MDHSSPGMQEFLEGETYAPGYRRKPAGLSVSIDQKVPVSSTKRVRKQSLARSDTVQTNSSTSTKQSFQSETSSPSSPTSAATSISGYQQSHGQMTDLVDALDRLNMLYAARLPISSASASDILSPSYQQRPRRPLFDLAEAAFEDPPLEFDLPCTFSFCHCTQTFRNKSRWMQHNLGHFHGLEPPTSTVCIFCDKLTFEHFDANYNWNNRMQHIFMHHLQHDVTGERPDFQLIKYMHEHRLIDEEHYAHLTSYSERSKHMDDLLAEDTETPQPHKFNEIPNQKFGVAINQRKQDRKAKTTRRRGK